MSIAPDSPDGEYVNGYLDQTDWIARKNPELEKLSAMLTARLKRLDHNDPYHAGGTDATRDALAGLIITEGADA